MIKSHSQIIVFSPLEMDVQKVVGHVSGCHEFFQEKKISLDKVTQLFRIKKKIMGERS
jgi:hypothetical protein